MSRPLNGYRLCPECGQPILKKGQQRKHPDDYRHARGCPRDEEEHGSAGVSEATVTTADKVRP